MTIEHDTAGTRDSKETARGAVDDLAHEASKTAQNAKDRVTDEVSRQAEAGRDGVANEISDMGQALRRAAEELRSGSPQERTFGQMANTLADLSDTVRDKDLGEIVNDVSGFARRNPVGFLAGAALLGFAGTRLAKASSRNTQGSVDLSHMWDTDEHDDELETHISGRTPASAAAPAAVPPGPAHDRASRVNPTASPVPGPGSTTEKSS